MINKIEENIKQSIECKQKILNDKNIIAIISRVCDTIVECYRNGNKICICGNGGSAADAQHFAAELVGRYLLERQGLPAIAFTTDTSILTAVGNDYGYDMIFKRQTEAMIKEGDILIGITTSGNSNNILLAFEEANKRGAKTVGLLGKDGGKCKNTCDYPIVVDWPRTPNIQEAHIMIIHIICELVERILNEK